jgi:hypothetical protein
MNSNEISPQKGGWLTHFARWLFSRRGLRAILILLVWVVTLVFLVYAFENWRGKKAWNQVKADLEKRGEVWRFEDIVPKPVPAEQNFASLPLVTNWFDPLQRTNSPDDKHPLAIARTKLGKPKRDRTRLDPMVSTDLIAWARALELGTNAAALDSAPDIPPTSPEENTPEARARAAGVVLAALAVDESSLAQIRDALRHPYSRYPVNFDTPDPWSILLPHLAKVKMWAQRLTLKASAELALGRTDAALQDVQTALGLENSLRDEPFLISYLVRVAILKIAVQPVWEGLQDHRWNEEQLKSLVEQFSNYDLVPALRPCLATERAASIKTLELVRRHGELVGSVADAGPFGVTLARLLPSGWYYCEMANYSRIMDWLLWDGLDLKGQRVHPDVLNRNQQSFESSRRSPVKVLLRHELAAGLFLPALTQVARRATQGQAIADFAALACALEHYRLRNSQFPDSLVALVPASIAELPKDWITGAPYQYRKTDTAFLLYSVGWDQKDEAGGTRITKGDEHLGDWVWGYAFP